MKSLCKVLKDRDESSFCEITLYDNHEVRVSFMDEGEFYRQSPSAYQADDMYIILCRKKVVRVEEILPYGFRKVQ